MHRTSIRRAAALIVLIGQLLLPLPLYAMTAAGDNAVCSARALSPTDRSAPAGALHDARHCAVCASGLGCAASAAPASLSPIDFSPPRALAPPVSTAKVPVRNELADARAPPVPG